MRGGAGAVHADREAGEPGFFEAEHDLARKQGGGARRERDADADFPRMGDQFEQIRPFDGVTASENEDGNFEVGDLIDELLAFLGREFHGVALRLRGGAAMHAGQIAGLGDFPDGDERALVEIDGVNERVHGLYESGKRKRVQ
jgi:hypothetical protein